jgi:hypothetical protein
MLKRILVFVATHPNLFEKGSRPERLVSDIEAAAGRLSEDAISQTSGAAAVRRASAERASAREALRSQLLAISRTAKGLGLKDFWIDGEGSDRALIEFAHIFARKAEPDRERFVESRLSPRFIEDLNKAIQDLELKIQDQAINRSTRTAATAALQKAQSEALAAVQALDPVMENLLRHDPRTLTVWQNARRLERTRKPEQPEAVPQATSSVPPQPPANSAA